MNIQQLKDRSVEAWTLLVRQQHKLQDETVIDVQAEELGHGRTRFTLSLFEWNEPLSVIGFQTNQAESTFYSQYAAGLNDISPKSWFDWQDREGGWIVVEETGPYHAPTTWSRPDLERVCEKLATFHSVWWAADNLKQTELPFHPVVQAQSNNDSSSTKKLPSDTQSSPDKAKTLLNTMPRHSHAIPELMIASVGFKMLKKLGGWPDLIEGVHLSALDHLLSEPELMLEPLQQVPLTVLHGQPVAENWQINLMDETRLTNWRTVSIGPAVCDLAVFLEDYIFWQTPRPDLHRTIPGSLEEMLIDTYLMNLGEKVALEGESRPGSSRYMRRYGLPAAICWHTVSHWLPTFVTWFNRMPASRHTWEIIEDLNPESIKAWGLHDLAIYRPAIGGIFDRFLTAYKLIAAE